MRRSIIFSMLIIFAFSASSFAQDLISVTDLLAIYKNKEVVVIDCSKPATYKAGHIPYSINVDHHDLYKTSGVESMLSDAAVIARILGAKGVANNSKIVLYDEGSAKYSGRMYWILKYMGATDVKILDGNLKAWKAARKPVTAAIAKKSATTFTASVKSAYLADMADVKAAQKSSNAVLVDVRPVGEFNGSTGTTTRKGHIPSSVNLFFEDMLNADGTMKSKAQIEALAKAKGITSNKEIILYCTSSVRAGIVFMALKSVCGYSNVKVYDGAFAEWEATSANEVDQ